MMFCVRVVVSAALASVLAACEFPRPPDRPGNSLTVQVVGEGNGTVTGGGISCSTGDTGTCTVEVPEGTEMTLSRMTGTAATGSRVDLGVWGRDCASAGTAESCTIAVVGDLTASASFTLAHRLDLTISAGSTGQGQLTATPGALACMTGTCGEFFAAAMTVSVEALPGTPLDRVSSVTGDCASLPCTITIDRPRAVTASFTRDVCAASSTTCSLGRFTACDATGNYVVYGVPNGGNDGTATTLVMHDYACPLGCHASGTRCNDVAPTNQLTVALDSPGATPSGVDLVLPRSASAPTGLIVIDTNNFDAGASETTITDTDGSTFRVPAHVVTQTDAPEILAIAVRSFTLRAGHLIEVRGNRALAIASHFDIYLAGTFDLAGENLRSPFTRVAPGSATSGACMGTNAVGIFGGSGNAGEGGASSDASAGGMVQGGAPALRGGCGVLDGGTGGGAVQFVSRTRIALGPTALVDVSGAGGRALGEAFPTGGGSGGTVVIEAPSVNFAPGAVIGGRGGSGAAANINTQVHANGQKGTISGAAAAASVTCTGCGTSGIGATEVSFRGGDATTSAFPAGGGGGGGVGRCIVRNAGGVFSPPAGAMKIFSTISTVATR